MSSSHPALRTFEAPLSPTELEDEQHKEIEAELVALLGAEGLTPAELAEAQCQEARRSWQAFLDGTEVPLPWAEVEERLLRIVQ